MRSRRPVAVATLLLAVAVSACRSGRPETASPTTSSLPGVATSAVTAPVTVPAGTPRTTTTLLAELTGGQARLSGTITGVPDLNGITVRIERFVGDSVATTEVPSDGGSWSLEGIPGGRYRVTAFRSPDVGQVAPEAFFLGATENRTLNLVVARAGEGAITATVNPSPPPLDRPFRLTVQMTNSSIDAQGRIAQTGRSGVGVQLVVGPGLLIDSEPVVLTDGNGNAVWQLQCTAPGPVPVAIVVGNGRSPVNIPPCGG